MSNAESSKIRTIPAAPSLRYLAVLVLLLAFFLRVRTLGAKALWFDEALEFWVAAAPFWDVYGAATQLTYDPPLYAYVLHTWSQIGQHEFWLRLPSLFFSLLGLSALWRLGRLSLGAPGALFVGLLVACSVADVRYAQEVGQYALMLALLSLNLFFLFMARRRRVFFVWILWGVTAALSIYSHYGAGLVIGVTSLIWLVDTIRLRDWRMLQYQFIAAAGAGILLAPLLLLTIPAQINRFAPHLAPFAATEFLQRSNAILLFHLVGNAGAAWLAPATSSLLITLPLLFILLLAFWRARSLTSWPVLLAAVWLGAFFLGLNAIYVFAGTRHSLLLAPLLMLTIGAGLTALWRRQRAVAGLALLYLVALSLLAPPEPQQDLRSVADYWMAGREDDHLTYVYYGAVPGFRYQLLLQEGGAAWTQVPPDWYIHCWAAEPAPYCTQDGVTFGRWMRELDAPEKATRLFEALGRRPDQFWLIFSHTSEREMADLLRVLGADYQIVAEHRASHAAAFLLGQRS